MRTYGRTWLPLTLALAAGHAAPIHADLQAAEDVADLTPQLLALEQRRNRIQDVRDIKRLQRSYGYYLDQGQWDDAADLFATEGRIEFGLDGIYVGRERVRAYLYALGNGRRGLRPGELNEHFQLMPVVTVAADGQAAQAPPRIHFCIICGETRAGSAP